jgi:S-layer homology domain
MSAVGPLCGKVVMMGPRTYGDRGSMPYRLFALVAAVVAVVTSIASPARADRIMDEHFEEYPWSADADNAPWSDVRSADLANSGLGPGFLESGLSVTIPAGEQRGVGPFYGFKGKGPLGAWFRYYVWLERWRPTYSGKLPGLSGVYGSSAKGCIPPEQGNPGWSARLYWLPPGVDGVGVGETAIGSYVYHLDQPTECGNALAWNPGELERQRWHCIQGHVRMNTLGQSNGVLEGWIDGVKAFRRADLRFRLEGQKSVRIKQFWLDVFFGGPSATPNKLVLRLDEIAVSKDGRPGCIDPFTDDNTSTHEGDLTDLHARGFIEGCSRRLACPDDNLTRAEMAVLLVRVLSLPKTDTNHFRDDNDHWAEPYIDRLAASGITMGCDRRLFCPEDPVTRAELATFLDRAYEPPGTSQDFFGDDDDHWARHGINRLAAAGVINGCTATAFCPEATITRGQTAALLARAVRWAEGLTDDVVVSTTLSDSERDALTAGDHD